MAAPSSFMAVEDILTFLTVMGIMYDQQKNKQKQNPKEI